MIYLVKVLDNALQKGYRAIKILGLGKSDVQTPTQAAPHGIDSVPVKGMIAVYANTGVKGDNVLIGYLDKNRLAEAGETRLFSTDPSGALKFAIWLKADGTCEMGGTDDNMVRYSKLEEAFNELREDHNNLVEAFNSHVHASAAPGTPTPPTTAPGIPAQPSSADIAPAKIDEIKTI